LKSFARSLVNLAALVLVLVFAVDGAAAGASPASESVAEATEIVGFELSVARTPSAADCPDAPALSAETQRVGTDPTLVASAHEAGLLVTQVVFDRDADGYFAELRSTGRKSGVRVVRNAASTCAPLAEAVTVVLAVLLDLLPDDIAQPVPERAAAAPTARADRPPMPRPGNPPHRNPLALALGIDAGLGAGVLAHVAAGSLGGAARPSYGRWELGAGVLWAPTRSLPYLGRTVDVSLLGARVTGCAWSSPRPGRFGFAGCAGVLLAAMRGQGHGFDQDEATSQLWPVAEAGLRARLALGQRLFLRLGVTGLLPLRRLTFSVAGRGVAYETPSFGALAEIGPELRFE
jgi:hypothetical protein